MLTFLLKITLIYMIKKLFVGLLVLGSLVGFTSVQAAGSSLSLRASSSIPKIQAVSIGAKNVKIGEYEFYLEGDSIRVDSIDVRIQQNSTSAPVKIQNLRLISEDGVTLGTVTGSPIISSSVSTSANHFTAVNFTLPSNRVKKVGIYADIDSDAQDGATMSVSITSVASYTSSSNIPVNALIQDVKYVTGVSVPSTLGCQGTTPSITFVSPLGGETYHAGQQVPIKWKSCNVQNVTFSWAVGGHDLGHIIESTVPAAYTTYYWTVPNSNIIDQYGHSNYKLMIESLSPQVSVISNTFNIIDEPTPAACSVGTPSVQVLSPNGNELYQAGQQVRVKWNSCNIGESVPVSVSLVSYKSETQWSDALPLTTVTNNYGDAGVLVTLPPSVVITDGSPFGGPYIVFNYGNQKVNMPAGKYFKISVVASNTNTGGSIQGTDQSDALFSIGVTQFSLPNAKVTVTSPNGGQTYHPGQDMDVTWTSQGLPSTATVIVNIEKKNGTGVRFITAPTKTQLLSSGHAVVTIPTDAGIGSDYRVRVTAVAPGLINEVFDESDATFVISPGSTTSCSASGIPSIKVLSPNGGEVFTPGQEFTPTWTTCNIPGGDKIVAVVTVYDSRGNGAESIGYGQVADGSVHLKLPSGSDYSKGTIYKLLLRWLNPATNNYVDDYSDTYFTIGSRTITPVETTPTLPGGCLPGYKFNPLTGQVCTTHGTVTPPILIGADCSVAVFTKVLRLGQSGSEVEALQGVLNDQGYLADSDVDGRFGLKTKAALIAFQGAQGGSVLVTGYTGSTVRGILNLLAQKQCMAQ
jgi:hypothetical protein